MDLLPGEACQHDQGGDTDCPEQATLLLERESHERAAPATDVFLKRTSNPIPSALTVQLPKLLSRAILWKSSFVYARFSNKIRNAIFVSHPSSFPRPLLLT